VFVLSGASALLYQIVWQRLLILLSGSDIYSSTLVIASFMTGLGIGHGVGGFLADRRSPRGCLLLFAKAEAAIAVFGVLSRFLYYDGLYQRLAPLGLPPVVIAPVLFVSLLWPTFFMGVSLPLLARALTEDLGRAPVRIGWLYGLNTLGASAGALVTTWLVLPRLGLEGALWVGAAANLACALLVLQSLRRPVLRGEATDAPAPAPAAGEPAPIVGRWQPAFLVWAVVYGFAGFLALSLEIVWFRLLGVIVKSTAFTFGTLVAVYLAGLAAGSLAGSRFVYRIGQPAGAFLAVQGGVGLSAGLALSAFLALAARVDWLRTYLAGYEPLNIGQNLRRIQLRAWVEGRVFTDPAQTLPWEAVLLYLLIPALLISVPTFLMGFAFPILQRVVQTDFARLGRHVGLLLVANIAGSAAGTLLTGWLALNLLGTAGTIRVLLVLSAAFPVLALRTLGPASPSPPGTARLARAGAGALAAGVFLIALLSPDAETLWTRLHGAGPGRIVFAEDATGLSVLRTDGAATGITVFVNGIGQSWMPYGGIHSVLGLLPAFIHPDPRQIAIIGLGSGDTIYAAAGRQEVEGITCIEIVRPQLETLASVASRYPYEGLRGLLNDPRIRHVSADGRLTLMRSAARFDIIEADALRPTSAYSGALFSDGYFELIRRRLRPQGLAVTWSPTVRVHNAFVRVYPYVVALPEILIGSNDPIRIDREAVLARLRDPRVRGHYARAGIPVDELVDRHLVELARYTPAFDRSTLTDFNTDLFPRDELDRPAAPWNHEVQGVQGVHGFTGSPGSRVHRVQ
jgi:predicted membrane-bound spermidine synthase